MKRPRLELLALKCATVHQRRVRTAYRDELSQYFLGFVPRQPDRLKKRL
jgi:hypothetical protein